MEANDILTIDAITQLLAADTDRLASAERDLLAAQTRYERATNRFTFSTDEGHQGALIEHEPILAEAEAKAMGIAAAAERNSRRVLAQTQRTEPRLSPEEWQAAESRRQFVAEDAERMRLPAVRDAVAHAIATGDRPAMALWARYGNTA